jgi:hypothetical protein
MECAAALATVFADSTLEGNGFELPVPFTTEGSSYQPSVLGELGFGLTNHQKREADGCQYTEPEQRPVEETGPIS